MKRISSVGLVTLSIAIGAAFLLQGLAAATAAAQQPGRGDAARKAIADAEAMPTPRLPDGHPDLTGRWGGGTGSLVFTTKDGEVHSLLPAREAPNDPNKTVAQFNVLFDGDARRAANANKPPYKPEVMDKVKNLDLNENTMDPSTKCHPSGLPRAGAPARIVASAGVVVFLYSGEDGNPWRLIPTDGRPHREDLDPSYFGDSAGHWEGDTLVVDVNDFNDDTWFGSDGWFHSDALHVVERITRKGNVLHYQATVEDPNVLTRPWVMDARTIRLDTKSDDEIFEMAPCQAVDVAHYVNHDHF